MRVLAFDTATARTAVALRDFDDAANVCLRTVVDLTAADDPPAGARPGHAQHLLTLIQGLLEQSGSGWEEVDRIAVGTGPGTFTGLRIGIATAQALAAATATPLVGVSTLLSLERAALAPLAAPRPVLAVIDARRGEAFVGGDGTPPCVLAPELLGELVAARASRGVIAVGDGALKFRALLEHAGAHVPADDAPLHRVSAREHCALALEQAPAGDGRVEPEYLRLPDAELARA
ncbi:MAG TPA: tRNA (adenosine(37)-N6)-threonylcarbamoyltransferase complex dimerization subunit type 1 TsaB [Solirubrobacteraceae bacterium]|jgi:tRNA threonylcarbamoyladenosine biosynthesis protein TsaB|nr:tRNA (adenosine(37)-N6)-threonylcarbamoyltransferase complex dimerization subunit type 1 TsaB [Solirubrobacteraceae bacterium]